MSRVEVIDVPEWLVNDALLRIETEERLTRCASGRQLAFRYVPDSIGSLPQETVMKVTNRLDLVRALAFDKWVGNCDNRQAIFLPHGKEKYRVMFIDQHQCFNADRWAFPDLPHHGAYEYKHVYRSVTDWLWFEPTLSLIEKIGRFDLWKFATEIPPEWYAHDTDALSRLVERLYRRRSIIRDLITAFRNSKRHPFPNWRG
jgi:hypothetical protein